MNRPIVHAATLAVPPAPNDHSLGAEHARVVVIEYGDFECPNCRMAAPTPLLLLERYAGGIRFIYRHFPLQDAHPHALAAAEASEAAAAQGQFWRMHDLLFQGQGHLQRDDLNRYAGLAHLDLARYSADIDDHIHLQKVNEQIDGGRRSHIRATPAFFVNGVVQDVSFGMQGLHDAVDAAMRGL